MVKRAFIILSPVFLPGIFFQPLHPWNFNRLHSYPTVAINNTLFIKPATHKCQRIQKVVLQLYYTYKVRQDCSCYDINTEKCFSFREMLRSCVLHNHSRIFFSSAASGFYKFRGFRHEHTGHLCLSLVYTSDSARESSSADSTGFSIY